MPSHRRGHVKADTRVHYVSRNAAHRGSRRIRADRDVRRVHGHNDEHSHGRKAFVELFTMSR
jgi:hypothetical protein